jgi:cyclopropane fatty-acyl-phospholipid synthase-like methyltransferase
MNTIQKINNKQTQEYWRDMATNNPTELTIKVNPVNDHTQIDADFILKYANSNSQILDLASGTGLTINKYFDKVGHIDAVELYEGFSQFILKTPKITVHNLDILEFQPCKQYDIITMFGILHYFNENETKQIYSRYRNYLKPEGFLIVKQQFGVDKDVEISGFSEELQRNYFSQYRQIDKEVELLKKVGYKNIEVVDIYLPEWNRFENTHFYAIVAEK